MTSLIPTAVQLALRSVLVLDRKLDRGNPNPGNIGADFNRFGMEFWRTVKLLDGRNVARLRALKELNQWRNAIAHQDFDPTKLGGTTVLGLAEVRAWRRACTSLAADFDIVMADHISIMIGSRPW